MKPLLFTFLFITTYTRLTCQNNGKPILTRTVSKPYQLSYQCLCPFDFSGRGCGEHRYVYCAITKTDIVEYDPKKSMDADVTFQMECFLKDRDMDQNQNQTKPKVNNFVRLPINNSQIKEMRESDNYYISPDYKIIWANDTSLFDENGEVIIPSGSKQTQSSILNKYHPYQFLYPSHFYGFPLTNGKISYHFQTVRFMNDTLSLPEQSISFKTQTTINSDTIIGTMTITLKKQWEQFGMIRLQLMMEEHYGVEQRTYHKIGMNSAKWILYDPEQPTPEFKWYSDKLPVTVWMIFATVLMIVLVVGSRLVIKLYRSYTNRKNRKELLKEEQSEAY